MGDILILYYTKNDSTKKMARAISRGIESVNNIGSIIRTVESDHYNDDDDILVSKDDLEKCHGLIIGSPTHFGNMAAPLKAFLIILLKSGSTELSRTSLVVCSPPHRVCTVDRKLLY